jgi:hypothetical protein
MAVPKGHVALSFAASRSEEELPVSDALLSTIEDPKHLPAQRCRALAEAESDCWSFVQRSNRCAPAMKAVADNRRRSIQGPSEPPVVQISPRPGIAIGSIEAQAKLVAINTGTKKWLGVVISPGVVTASTRLLRYFHSLPQTYFRSRDLSKGAETTTKHPEQRYC